MSDVELRKEICYAFATAMGIHDSTIDDDFEFPFQYLQSSGQGTCSLCIPSVSKSFSGLDRRWQDSQTRKDDLSSCRISRCHTGKCHHHQEAL